MIYFFMSNLKIRYFVSHIKYEGSVLRKINSIHLREFFLTTFFFFPNLTDIISQACSFLVTGY